MGQITSDSGMLKNMKLLSMYTTCVVKYGYEGNCICDKCFLVVSTCMPLACIWIDEWIGVWGVGKGICHIVAPRQ